MGGQRTHYVNAVGENPYFALCGFAEPDKLTTTPHLVTCRRCDKIVWTRIEADAYDGM